MPVLRCSACSKDAPEDARFCPSCGAVLEASAVAQPTKTAVPALQSDPSSTHGRFLPGALLGERYRIVGLLGRGGMGEVYRADDLELGQSVALKFLPPELVTDPSALARIRSEVRTARQIAHPNVCRVYDIAEIEGQVFLSMEYVDGDDLFHVLRRLGPPGKDKAVEIARQLCLGLAAAHDCNVVHRDLKPANVMLDGRGRVRIMDFGLAGLAEELQAGSDRAGTPAYMAPEQLESGKVSIRSDIYSLGLVLYELFTGKRAFEGATLEELRRSRSSESIPSMRSQNESVDPAIERVILRCLEPVPADRPGSAYAVLGAFPGGDPLAAALAAGDTPSPEMVASARERGGLSPSWAAFLFVAVLVSLGLGLTLVPRHVVAPEKGPDELRTLARQLLRDLGHEPQRAQAWDMIQNRAYRNKIAREARSWGGPTERWPPPYFFWYRASPTSLRNTNIHLPVPRLGSPLAAPPGSAAVVLGSGGQLVELEVVPLPIEPDARATAATVDWGRVLKHTGLDPGDLEPTEPIRDLPAYCDEVVAYRVERPEAEGGSYVFQAGAHHGRVVHAATVWDWDKTGPIDRARGRHFRFVLHGNWLDWLLLFGPVLSGLLAWYNVRRGRGDRRGAITYGVVVFVAYLLYNGAYGRLSELGILNYLSWVLSWDPIGHAAMHAIHTTLLYLAIEPYVRRIWPRALIAWARLTRGRWRDPVVAREVLIGIGASLGGVVLTNLGWAAAATWRGQRGTFRLYGVPEVLGDTPAMAVAIPHEIALALFFVLMYYFVLLVIRLATRRDWATLILGVAFGASVATPWVFRGNASLPVAAMALAIGAILPTIYFFLMMRVGLVAALVSGFVSSFSGKIPMTLDMSRFWAPQSLLGTLLLVAIAAYGLRYSLAGRPVFGGLLGDAPPARDTAR